jgi:hypothetical protein
MRLTVTVWPAPGVTCSGQGLLFGPPRQTAVFAAWHARADAYLTSPSSPDVPNIMAKLRVLV